MLRVSIKSTELAEKSGVKAGREWKIREQTGWIDLESGERRKLAISIKDGAQPWPVGDYSVSPLSFYVDNFGALSLGRLVLEKIAAVKAA